MMPHVDGETLHTIKNIFLLSLTHFYSRIILKKLNPDQIGCHRKVERFLTKIIFFYIFYITHRWMSMVHPDLRSG